MGRRPDRVGSSTQSFLHARQLLVLFFVMAITFLCFIGSVTLSVLSVVLPEGRGELLSDVANRLWWAFSLLMTACVSFTFGKSLRWPSLSTGRSGADSDELPPDSLSGV